MYALIFSPNRLGQQLFVCPHRLGLYYDILLWPVNNDAYKHHAYNIYRLCIATLAYTVWVWYWKLLCKISYSPCFLPGDDKQQSHDNFMMWVDKVYDDSRLPCYCKVKSSDGTTLLKGVYHHLTHEQADRIY